MWKILSKAASPKTCFDWAGRILPWLAIVTLLTFAYGLIGGLWLAPADYQQGNAYRVMFIHVPAAVWSLGVYVIMSSAAMIFLIWKIKIADMIASLSVPIGAAFTLLALITGALWGKPTWGTYWIWDARLTSELILLFIYGGIVALRSAIPDSRLAAQAGAILTLVGLVNIPIIHYSVDWWQTLHQGATILKFGAPSISGSMLRPLLSMLIAFLGYYCWILLIGLRYQLLLRERQTHWVKQLIDETR